MIAPPSTLPTKTRCGPGNRYSIDHRIVRPDGTVRIVHEEADLMLDEVTGRPSRVVGTVQDITERQQAEAARMRLAAIVDSSATPSWARISTAW